MPSLESRYKQKEGNKVGEDLLGSRWLHESFSSPGMKGDRERREGETEKRGIKTDDGCREKKRKN